MAIRSASPEPIHRAGCPVESFQPGMVEYLKPGQDIKFNNPPAAGGYREYKMTELQGIMAGIGLPYELGTGDMSQVNYSSWRGGMLGFRNTVEAFRWLTLIPLFCMPVWRRFIDTLILQGKIPASAVERPEDRICARVQWTAPRFESRRSGEGRRARELKMIRMGRKTWFEAVLENGYDPTSGCSRSRCSTSWWTNSKSFWIPTRATRRSAARSSLRQPRSAHTEFEAHRRGTKVPAASNADAEAIAELFSGTPASRCTLGSRPQRRFRS